MIGRLTRGVVVAVAVLSGCGPAQSTGNGQTLGSTAQALASWGSITGMSSARTSFTATRLGSGEILVVGGDSGNSTAIGTAELYDPSTGTWCSSATSLHYARFNHTATYLGMNKVLVVGGDDGSGPIATAEIYDRGTSGCGTWSDASSMNEPREVHAATALSAPPTPPSTTLPLVLVTGGNSYGYSPTNTFEIYDPATDTWQWSIDIGSLGEYMTTIRAGHTATLLGSGKVLVTGGYDADPLDSAEVYDPSTQHFTAVSSAMSVPHASHTATLLSNGKVLIVGGYSTSFAATDVAQLYEPSTSSWSSAGTMNVGRANHTATLLSSGNVLITGGDDFVTSSSAYFSSTELYDPSSGWASSSVSMASARSYHAASATSGGHVLVFGGNTHFSTLSSAEEYTP